MVLHWFKECLENGPDTVDRKNIQNKLNTFYKDKWKRRSAFALHLVQFLEAF